MKESISRASKYLLLALLIYMPVFGFLNTLPIRVWDEARTAINAYEMYYNHDFIVTHFNYSEEMWNTKPPLLIWLQVFFMKLIGMNEISVRLPSALAAFFTCVALLVFSERYLKSFWLGFICVLVLVTSQGYINQHISRTGEYDALLTLFTTLSCLLYYAFCETKNNRYLYLFFLALTLAVLTKGIAGLLFCPAFVIYAAIRKQFGSFLKNKHFYFGCLSFLMVVGTYYFLREMKNPGYLAVVQENELGGRYLKVQGTQSTDFWFYLNNFKKDRLADRYFLVPFGLLAGFISRDERIRKFTLFVLLMSLTFFIVISTAKTKLEQYDAPLYPFLSILIALLVYSLFEIFRGLKWIREKAFRKAFPFLFLILAFIIPYQKIWAKTYLPTEQYYWDVNFYEISYYLKDALKGEHDLNGKCLVYNGYNYHNIFYIRLLNDRGVGVSTKEPELIQKGDAILVCQDHLKQFVKEHFLFKEEKLKGNIISYTITGQK